ncbi:M23 family metallopeptidase [Microbispora sp. RL4-1S]|uniref:M23 family metallopeptidase n=1 Tax=Microbispora oryzae TaxID=2806554 RepID=A0A940WJE4_9ACTN|nr:M23 family metallopeptidase [Microbispora oryzae]MBP2702630.1 M23 family metallopeptidase [Microbispora oryzae]
MRSGRLAALLGAACLAASCGAPAGVAGVSTSPPTPPAGANGAATGVPPVEDPVRVPPPKLSPYTYVFPVKDCKASYARKLLVLPKTTIWAGRGCAFVSPVDGVVTEVNDANRWSASTDRGQDREGRFVSVRGEDGVVYLGGHLDSVEPGLAPGAKVKAGQQLGKVGNSGNAQGTATNLYFAMSWPAPPQYWWIRRGVVPPWTYLDAWDDGNRTLSPRKEALRLRQKLGPLPKCVKLCASQPASSAPDQQQPPQQSHKPTKTTKPDDPKVVIPL